MQSLRQVLNRIRAWRGWRVLRRSPARTINGVSLTFPVGRPILREVSRQGVRVYSLCGSCGAHLAASATLCEACARSRSLPNS